MFLYKLHRQGYLIKIFPFFKSTQTKIVNEFNEFQISRSGYEELNLAKDLDLPFKFVKKVKRKNTKKIKVPGWIFYLGTNKNIMNFFKNSFIIKKYNNSDPSNEYLDKKLIDSILEEINKLDEN
jgi:hypothetical protein